MIVMHYAFTTELCHQPFPYWGHSKQRNAIAILAKGKKTLAKSNSEKNIRFSQILRNSRRNLYKSCASTSYNFPCNCAICRRVSLNVVYDYESLYKIRIVL